MMEPRLRQRLEGFTRMMRRARLFQNLAVCWAIAAAAGLMLFLSQKVLGLDLGRAIPFLPLFGGIIFSAIILMRQSNRLVDIPELLKELEPEETGVRHLVAAAAEQRPSKTSGAFGFLQMRVIQEALRHPRQAVWQERLQRQVITAQSLLGCALIATLVTMVALHHDASTVVARSASPAWNGVTVTPGDAQIERGTALVVAARFGGKPPPEATLVLNSEAGKETRLAMARQLADPVFGASVPEISGNCIYHIEYEGKKTRDFKITVFEFPALVRADAEVRYPAYTGLTNRTIRDALRVSAVEGSRLGYTLELNKPVARARLVGKERSFDMASQSNAIVLLPEILLTNSARFSLELVDAEGRSNKFATDFILQALTNQRPNVRIVFPHGDVRVSRLQELQLQAEASDDFGLLKYGMGFGIAGKEPQLIELGQSAPANVKKQFSHTVSLENLGVEVDDSVAYFAWADDYGPDGEVRRTYTDMFFAEVRPFDEVFRADQSGAAENGGQAGGGSGSGGGDQRVKLADLQKQIVIATWNIQREKSGAGRPKQP